MLFLCFQIYNNGGDAIVVYFVLFSGWFDFALLQLLWCCCWKLGLVTMNGVVIGLYIRLHWLVCCGGDRWDDRHIKVFYFVKRLCNSALNLHFSGGFLAWIGWKVAFKFGCHASREGGTSCMLLSFSSHLSRDKLSFNKPKEAFVSILCRTTSPWLKNKDNILQITRRETILIIEKREH